jgi:hypothetical protein
MENKTKTNWKHKLNLRDAQRVKELAIIMINEKDKEISCLKEKINSLKSITQMLINKRLKIETKR